MREILLSLNLFFGLANGVTGNYGFAIFNLLIALFILYSWESYK
jgi:hypothetical protein